MREYSTAKRIALVGGLSIATSTATSLFFCWLLLNSAIEFSPFSDESLRHTLIVTVIGLVLSLAFTSGATTVGRALYLCAGTCAAVSLGGAIWMLAAVASTM